MNRLDGKVVFISGAARGQGRSHAVAAAREGADIIAFDQAADIGTVPYGLGTESDLEHTAELVRAEGRRIVTGIADVRDSEQIQRVLDAGVAQFGRVDVVLANAGVQSFGAAWELSEEQWDDVIDVNLTGVWRTVKAAVPLMIEARSGSIIVTSSFAGFHAIPNMVHYTAAKHGATGLMRSFATELAPYGIRANSIHPATVRSPMIDNAAFLELVLGAGEGATLEDVAPEMQKLYGLPIPWVEVEDVSNAIIWLASDEARYVTGVALPLDGGARMPFRAPHLEAVSAGANAS